MRQQETIDYFMLLWNPSFQDWTRRGSYNDNLFIFYNTQPPHQAPGYRTPADVFGPIPVEVASAGVLEFLVPDPLKDGRTQPWQGLCPALRIGST